MDIVLLITSEKNTNRINMVRGDKRFVQKTLEQVFGISKSEMQVLFADGHCENAEKEFALHENFNSLYQDIESLKSIHTLLQDVERLQMGEYVQILRDAVMRIEQTIQNVCHNFSE